jgi:hypothetical protein
LARATSAIGRRCSPNFAAAQAGQTLKKQKNRDPGGVSVAGFSERDTIGRNVQFLLLAGNRAAEYVVASVPTEVVAQPVTATE